MNSKTDSIRWYLDNMPTLTTDTIATACGVGVATVEALKHPNRAKQSDTAISAQLGVDQMTGLQSLEAKEVPKSPERTGRGGRPVNSANIGTVKAVHPRSLPKYLPTETDIATACDRYRRRRMAASERREETRKQRILRAASATKARKRLADLDACRDCSVL
jgi:hypothetical protein